MITPLVSIPLDERVDRIKKCPDCVMVDDIATLCVKHRIVIYVPDSPNTRFLAIAIKVEEE